MTKYYLAYGSNLNLWQMKYRCPGNRIVGTGSLQDYEMTFRSHNTRGGVANIEPKKGSSVLFAVFSINDEDEENLDWYEGYPRLYTKVIIPVTVDGRKIDAMAYIMTGAYPLAEPSRMYVDCIEQGYRDFGFDPHIFNDWVVANRAKIKRGKKK